MHSTKSSCTQCKQNRPITATRLVTLFHFCRLYLVGIFELLRQILYALPLPAPRANNRDSHSATPFADSGARSAGRGAPVFILTGGTSGIGLAIRHALRPVAARLILLAHHNSRGPVTPTAAAAAVANDDDCDVIPVDLSALHSTLAAVHSVSQLAVTFPPESPVILILCAGIYNKPLPTTNPIPATSNSARNHNGVVAHTFDVNTLSSTLLMYQLKPHIHGILCIGSSSQVCARPPPSTLCPPHFAGSPYAAYPASKLALLAAITHFTNATGMPALVVHPGIVATSLYASQAGPAGGLLRLVVRHLAWSPRRAAPRILHVAQRAQLFEHAAVHLQRRRRLQPVVTSAHRMPIYWDAVRLAPAPSPSQIATQSEASCFTPWIYESLGLSPP